MQSTVSQKKINSVYRKILIIIAILTIPFILYMIPYFIGLFIVIIFFLIILLLKHPFANVTIKILSSIFTGAVSEGEKAIEQEAIEASKK